MSLVRPAFAVIGLLMVTTGVVSVVAARRRKRTWHVGSGEVVSSRLDGDGHIRFQVAFQYDHREVLFWNRYTSASGIDPVGRTVDLLISPDDPVDAVVTRGAANARSVGPVFIVAGIAAIFIGLLAPIERRARTSTDPVRRQGSDAS